MTTSPLHALVQAYDNRMQWTLSMDHLGRRGCSRHSFAPSALPAPDIKEIGTQTKEPHVLCVEAMVSGGISIIPIKAPCSYSSGSKITKDLVWSGVHPLDIIIASVDPATVNSGDPQWAFRTSIDWMFWTHEDQKKLDADEAKQ